MRERILYTQVIVTLALTVLMGCQKAKSDPPESVTPEQQVYDTESVRLKGFSTSGFVVTLAGAHDSGGNAPGTVLQTGNSLLFTSIALAALTCEDGLYIATAEQSMLTSTGGSLYHHPTLPSGMDLDDAIGFYRGAAESMRHCGVSSWAAGLKLHQSIEPLINKAGNVGLDYPFTWLRTAVLNQAGLGPAPSDTDQAILETTVAGWAEADMAAKAACYRLHLGLQVMQTIEATGHTVSANGRNAFCSATNGSAIPTLDHWCGRGDITTYIDTYQEDVWQYRHQRCTAWEQPDGNGDNQPSEDVLIAYRDLMTGEE